MIFSLRTIHSQVGRSCLARQKKRSNKKFMRRAVVPKGLEGTITVALPAMVVTAASFMMMLMAGGLLVDYGQMRGKLLKSIGIIILIDCAVLLFATSL